jgi:quinol-cytochrome oxidoreductase complex cytochrome b subunit
MKSRRIKIDWWVHSHIFNYRVPTPKVFWLSYIIGFIVQGVIGTSNPFTAQNLIAVMLSTTLFFFSLFLLTLTHGRVVIDQKEYSQLGWKNFLGFKK